MLLGNHGYWKSRKVAMKILVFIFNERPGLRKRSGFQLNVEAKDKVLLTPI